MEQIECWGCEQTFDKSDIKYFRPFAGGERVDGNTIQTYAGVTDHETDGSKPYCPTCLKGHTKNDD
jgi:hypothetical protein